MTKASMTPPTPEAIQARLSTIREAIRQSDAVSLGRDDDRLLLTKGAGKFLVQQHTEQAQTIVKLQAELDAAQTEIGELNGYLDREGL